MVYKFGVSGCHNCGSARNCSCTTVVIFSGAMENALSILPASSPLYRRMDSSLPSACTEEVFSTSVSATIRALPADTSGVVIVAAHATSPLAWVFIFLAAVLGTMNVVGGYVVTDRMLEMFKSDKGKKKEEEAK